MAPGSRPGLSASRWTPGHASLSQCPGWHRGRNQRGSFQDAQSDQRPAGAGQDFCGGAGLQAKCRASLGSSPPSTAQSCLPIPPSPSPQPPSPHLPPQPSSLPAWAPSPQPGPHPPIPPAQAPSPQPGHRPPAWAPTPEPGPHPSIPPPPSPGPIPPSLPAPQPEPHAPLDWDYAVGAPFHCQASPVCACCRGSWPACADGSCPDGDTAGLSGAGAAPSAPGLLVQGPCSTGNPEPADRL